MAGAKRTRKASSYFVQPVAQTSADDDEEEEVGEGAMLPLLLGSGELVKSKKTVALQVQGYFANNKTAFLQQEAMVCHRPPLPAPSTTGMLTWHDDVAGVAR